MHLCDVIFILPENEDRAALDEASRISARKNVGLEFSYQYRNHLIRIPEASDA